MEVVNDFPIWLRAQHLLNFVLIGMLIRCEQSPTFWLSAVIQQGGDRTGLRQFTAARRNRYTRCAASSSRFR